VGVQAGQVATGGEMVEGFAVEVESTGMVMVVRVPAMVLKAAMGATASEMMGVPETMAGEKAEVGMVEGHDSRECEVGDLVRACRAVALVEAGVVE